MAGQNTDGREQTQLGQLGASKDAVEKGGGGERETERERATETARNITAQQVMTWASRVSPLAEHAATLLLLHSELADAVAGSDLRKHDKSREKSRRRKGSRPKSPHSRRQKKAWKERSRARSVEEQRRILASTSRVSGTNRSLASPNSSYVSMATWELLDEDTELREERLATKMAEAMDDSGYLPGHTSSDDI